MCGIVGYIGSKSAIPTVIDELKRLEYRGYDSAGVAVVKDGKLTVIKTVGKIKDLEKVLEKNTITAHIGVGHTRWATHGQPSTPNSHPHSDCGGKLAVVHNGIVENYLALKESLQAKGHKFASETDTEVIAHLIEEHYKTTNNLEAALRAAIKDLQGSYAIVVISEYEPDKLYVARKDSPMVLGLGEGENFIASDIPAVLPYTRKVFILEDGDVGILTTEGITLTSLDGKVIDREVFEVTWDAEAAEKGGYEHFMIKEIHEIPRAIRDTMRARVSDDNHFVMDELKLTAEEIKNLERVFIVACGTAYYAGFVGKYLFEKLLRVPVEVDIASEFRYREPIIPKNSLVIVISQSGETADTLAVLREARRQGVKVLGIVNVVGSSIYREADEVFCTWAGPEICVASTKAYVTQLIALYLVGFYFAKISGKMNDKEATHLLDSMKKLPDLVQHILDGEQHYIDMAKRFTQWDDFFFLGRGLDYAVSLEAALKLKEISYVHAEAYAAGELKHGPLALIWNKVPVMTFCIQEDLYDKMLSNVKEVAARDAYIIGVVKESDTETQKSVQEVVRVPEIDDILMPVLAIIPAYLLTYYLALALNREIDQPRNLAKSVTVE
jgi:glutamine---fructose-6-phosphate transaminase (isomerizing)